MGLSVFFQFLLGLLVGNIFDKGRGRYVPVIGTLFLFVAIVYRGIFVDSIWEVVVSDVFLALGFTLYMLVFNAVFYNLSSTSKNPLKFQYYAEFGWDVGAILGMGTAGLIVYMTDDLSFAMMIGLAGLILTNLILRKWFVGK